MRIRTVRWLLVALVMFTAAPGHALDLGKYQGNVVYLDFWASWCGPCVKSFPWMQSMHEKYASQGLKIVAVTVDESAADVEAFLKKYPVDFEIVHDPEGKLAAEYGLVGMPSSFIFDQQGRQLSRHVSFNNGKAVQYETEITKALGLAPANKP